MTAHRILAWSPSAIVFDCDGTLMDTERHWMEARSITFRSFGLKPPAGFAERAKGVHYAECGALMAEETGKPDLVDDLTAALLDNFMALVHEEPVTMPGAATLVRLAARYLPLAVASNCPREMVESCLDRAGLLPFFGHVVVAGEDVPPKPRPEVYQIAARLCGVPPQDALAVEDSLTGAESARRAGLRVLGIGSPPADRSAEQVDLWVESLAVPELTTWARDRIASRTPLADRGDGPGD
ncbi:HAD family phosphatase [Streptomyces sp. NPDC006296]|uniref:HAD family hydrolase n=1 Tax=Streptomyces sp. NPDC006296 TaxID=3156746 RepID=UPI0033A49BA0